MTSHDPRAMTDVPALWVSWVFGELLTDDSIFVQQWKRWVTRLRPPADGQPAIVVDHPSHYFIGITGALTFQSAPAKNR